VIDQLEALYDDPRRACALPYLRAISYALAGVVIASALAIVLIQKLRPW
jgi:hypothetical protein